MIKSEHAELRSRASALWLCLLFLYFLLLPTTAKTTDGEPPQATSGQALVTAVSVAPSHREFFEE